MPPPGTRLALALALLLLLAPALAQGGEPPARRRPFAPGTGNTCASFCSQRWYDDPLSARACLGACAARSLTGTSYFQGGMRDDPVDCNERLVSPALGLGECSGERGFPSRQDPYRPRF
jgi:hypothetical protein